GEEESDSTRSRRGDRGLAHGTVEDGRHLGPGLGGKPGQSGEQPGPLRLEGQRAVPALGHVVAVDDEVKPWYGEELVEQGWVVVGESAQPHGGEPVVARTRRLNPVA